MSEFGDRLRRFREAKGWSLDQLGSETGISRAYLWKLERKEGVNPGLDVLKRLARALGTTVGDLAADAPAEVDAPEIPASLVACQAKYQLSDDKVADLAGIRFRGGHPQDPDDWYELYLQLRRTVGVPET